MKSTEYKSLNKVIDTRALWRSRIALFGILVVMVGLFSPVGGVRVQATDTKGTCILDPSNVRSYIAYNVSAKTCQTASGKFVSGLEKLGVCFPSSGPGTIKTSDDCKNLKPPGDWQESGSRPLSDSGDLGSPQGGANDGTAPTSACSAWSLFCLTDILSLIVFTIMKLLSLAVGLMGLLLNLVLDLTIIKMSSNLAAMTGINTAWKVIRDLMNIAFIFMLVYEGILVIIDQKSLQDIKKFVTGIVLASLLINFSLFFTKVLIDASNVVTIGIYNSIIEQTNATSPNPGLSAYGGLSNAYMGALGLQKFWSTNAILPSGNGTDSLAVNLSASVLILVVSFVFLAISVMFLIRYLVLIILLTLSPIAYMGMALPQMQPHAKKWWSSLNGQLVFPPVFMIMTWVVLTLIAGGNFTGANNLTDTIGSGENMTGFINILFNFSIIIGLTIASLVISKQFATQGAEQIGKMTGKATAFAGGAIMGGSARAFRGTVGRAGQAIADNQWLKERAPDSRLARMALSAGAKTGAATLDVRGTALGKDMGMGKAGGKGGFQQAREDKIKRRMQFAEKNIPDTVTGADVEREMAITNDAAGMNYSRANNETRVARLVATGRSEAQATAMVAEEVERVRLAGQQRLTLEAARNTERRRERYIHNLSQTRWNTPLYRGVYDNTDAARRMRAGQTSTNARDTLLRAIADYQAANPTTPPVVPPVVPPTP